MLPNLCEEHKGLFVSPDLNFHGGDKSLYNVLRSLKRVAPELLIPSWCHRGNRRKALQHLERQKVTNVTNLHFGFLPREYCYLGSPEGKMEWLKKWVKRGLWSSYRSFFYRKLRREKYSFIHINSLSLYPLISAEFPFYVHVREVVKEPSVEIISKLSRAKGIVFIDQTTKDAFRGADLPRSLVLPNPFDMTHMKGVDPDSILKRLSIPSSHVIFSLIGSITPVKGVDCAIKAFRQVENPNMALLIVGTINRSPYMEYCRGLAQGDRRIRFTGLVEDIEEIYAVSDYVLRGDPLFGLGRSMLEGLYAGSEVLIPGKINDITGVSDLIPFQGKIHLYTPGSVEELGKLIAKRCRAKVGHRVFGSNREAYSDKFENFVLNGL